MRTTKEALNIQRLELLDFLAAKTVPVHEIVKSKTLTSEQRRQYINIWQDMNREYTKLANLLEEID